MRDDLDEHVTFAYLHRVSGGLDLSSVETHEAMPALLEGYVKSSRDLGVLSRLKIKGETAAELAGFAHAMRERIVVVHAGADAVDTCGSGGNGSGRLISPP